MLLQKTKTSFHWIFAGRDNFADTDAELANGTLGTPLRDEPPSLECIAHAGEVLPFGAGIRLDMKHCESGPGHQCDLQGVREGNFAGLGKIRRMKNGLYLDFLGQVGVTHNLDSFRVLISGLDCPFGSVANNVSTGFRRCFATERLSLMRAHRRLKSAFDSLSQRTERGRFKVRSIFNNTVKSVRASEHCTCCCVRL